jgi:hypothetical protein
MQRRIAAKGASSVDSTLAVRDEPSGAIAKQSVKVPPRSMKKRHLAMDGYVSFRVPWFKNGALHHGFRFGASSDGPLTFTSGHASNPPMGSPAQQDTTRTSTVIILKKMQGSVWRETGRTGVCPTPEWLVSSFGEGEYELRLKVGNRVLCMVGVDTASKQTRRAG